MRIISTPSRIGNIALAGLLSFTPLMVAFGQNSKSVENVYLQPSQIPSPLHFQFLAERSEARVILII